MTSERRLRSIFRQELHRFAQVYPHVAGVRLILRAKHPEANTTARDLGWYDYETRAVSLIRAALQRSEGHLRGIIRHELGHAADTETTFGYEARADRIAAEVCNSPIRYTKEGLQHATHGKPKRPGWLHK